MAMTHLQAILIANSCWDDEERLWVYKSVSGDWLVRPGKPNFHRSSVSFNSHREAVKFASDRPWIIYRNLGCFGWKW